MYKSKFFNVGKVAVTRGINGAIAENQKFALEVELSLQRYCVKD